jgi:alpha-L-fucosidase
MRTLKSGFGYLCLAAAVWMAAVAARAAEPAPSKDFMKETKEERDARMKWWREARFGMFIHWGLYAVPAGEWNGTKYGGGVEWIMNYAKVPAAGYEPLLKKFNPVKYDPKEWVRIAKGAGMKYIVITSKHHEGFCLWPSKCTDYTVASTAYGKDLLKPLAKACKAEGITLCFYHSIMDWHHPDYLPKPGWETNPNKDANFDRYVEHLKKQLKELIQNYGPLGVLWFDGQWENTWTHERGVDMYNYVRGLQPSIIVNNRVDVGGQGAAGDFGTPEQTIPAKGLPGVDWETCMTMNGTWGYSAHDLDWKSSQDLIRKLVDIASKGGNFLLNVGPTGEGEIPPASVERLAAMGKWMKANGEAIHGTTASPLGKVSFGRVTAKPGRIYLHVFNWPKDGKIVLPGMESKVAKAYLLADPEKKALPFTVSQPGVVEIQVPAEAPDADASVIALEYKGELKVQQRLPDTIVADEKGVFTLMAEAADIQGNGPLAFEADKQCLGFWTSKDDVPSWTIRVTKPGRYQVELTHACKDGSAGTPFEVRIGRQGVKGTISSTGAWDKFSTGIVGTLEIRRSGSVRVRVVPLEAPEAPKEGVMNLKTIRLIPVP